MKRVLMINEIRGRLLSTRHSALGTDRGIAVLSVLLLMMMLSILGIALTMLISNVSRNTRTDIRDLTALDMAEAGISRACWGLGTNYGSCNDILKDFGRFPATGEASGTLDLGNFTYHVINKVGGDDKVAILATGYCQGRNKTIKVIAQINWIQAPSAVFNYALFSSIPTTLGGNSEVRGDVYVAGNVQIQRSVRILPAYDSQGNKVANGDLAAAGTVTNYGYVAGNQMPNQPVVDIPILRFDYYRDLTTYPSTVPDGVKGLYINGDVHWNSSNPMPESPNGIIYVNGSVKFSGNVEGKGTVIATNGFEVTGTIAHESGTNMLALLTNKTVKLAGTADVHGVVYAHSVEKAAEIDMYGTPHVVGCVVADLVETTGSIDVTYDPEVKSALNLPGAPISGQMQRLSWQEG